MLKFMASDIKELLPHRDPFLFVDAATIKSDTEIEGECIWRRENPIFNGHFPELPLVPGVCLLEAGAQVAGVLIAHKAKEMIAQAKLASQDVTDADEMVGVLTGITRVLIHHPLLPDQRARFDVQVKRALTKMFMVKGAAYHDDNKIVTFDIRIGVAKRSEMDLERFGVADKKMEMAGS